MRKIGLSAVSLLVFAVSSWAQFSVNGNESTSVKWNTFNTSSYQFIYPEGCDSLARVYALEWEKYKLSVGYDRLTRKPLPVVLHPYSATSNGFVVWTPSRMEMYTAPDMYSPEALPWHTLLAIHENRHVAQMQFLYRSPFKVFNIFGELLAGPFCLLYSTSMYMEGDAVATETALSRSGRGRSADFLEYIRASFEEGDTRNIFRWRYGSQKLYTPDYYKIGYLAAGGMGIGPHDEFFCNTLRRNFSEFAERLKNEWTADTQSRSPFQKYTQLTENEPYYLSYSGLAGMDGKIYAVQAGLARNTSLVSFDTQAGFKKKVLRHVGADSALEGCDGKLYWTEQLPDLRWEMHSTSALRSFDGKRIRTEVGGKRLYNPAAGGGTIALVENPSEGGSVVRVYRTGAKLQEVESYRAPSGLQPLEPVRAGGHLYASGLSDRGQGIYDVENGFEEVLEASPVKINHLFSENGRLCFTSDRTGVNELYAFDPQTGDVCQLTNLPRGGKDFVFMGDSLYFTLLSTGGRNICVTAKEDLPVRKVDFAQRYAYALADSLSALSHVDTVPDKMINTGAVKRYDRLKNAFRFHSWVPLYLESDELLTLSSEQLRGDGHLGATAYFQNNLSTLYGDMGVGYNLTDEGKMAPKASANITYRGLYPVFQAKAIVGSEEKYFRLRSYVPLNFSRDGWSAGVIPNLMYEQVPNIGALTYGVRAYKTLPVASSAIFPRLGIGASISAVNYFTGVPEIDTRLYPSAAVYGYLPGFRAGQSIALKASYESSFSPDIESYRMGSFSASIHYGLPFLSIDCARFSPLVYIRNFELIPFCEYNRTPWAEKTRWCVIGSYFDVVLANIWFVPYDITAGIKAGYNTDTKKVECNFVLSYDL